LAPATVCVERSEHAPDLCAAQTSLPKASACALDCTLVEPHSVLNNMPCPVVSLRRTTSDTLRIMFGRCRRAGSRSTRTVPSPARHPNRRSHTCNASIHGRRRTARMVRSVRPAASSRPESAPQQRLRPFRAHGHRSLTCAVVWRCAPCRRARALCRPALWKCVQMRCGRASSWSADDRQAINHVSGTEHARRATPLWRSLLDLLIVAVVLRQLRPKRMLWSQAQWERPCPRPVSQCPLREGQRR
jgi:hypothetical protein